MLSKASHPVWSRCPTCKIRARSMCLINTCSITEHNIYTLNNNGGSNAVPSGWEDCKDVCYDGTAPGE